MHHTLLINSWRSFLNRWLAAEAAAHAQVHAVSGRCKASNTSMSKHSGGAHQAAEKCVCLNYSGC